jgi:hypothetical protein
MATFVANGTAYQPATVVSPAPVVLPTHQTGDLLLVAVMGKYAATTPTPSAPTGWTLVRSATGGTVTTGNDAGDSFIWVYGKVATSGSETFSLTIGTLPNSINAIACAYRPTSGNAWTDASSLGSVPWVATNDTTAAVPLGGTGTFSTQPVAASGATLVAFGAIPTDLGTTAATPVITNSGLSGGTSTFRQYAESASGADSAGMHWDRLGFTGTATGVTTVQITPTGATNNYGPTLALWLRETTATPSVQQKAFRGRLIVSGKALNDAFT